MTSDIIYRRPKPITPQFGAEHLKEYLDSYCLCECGYCAYGNESGKCFDENCCLIIALNTVCLDLNGSAVVYSELFDLLDDICDKLHEDSDVCSKSGELCPISGYLNSLRSRILEGGL